MPKVFLGPVIQKHKLQTLFSCIQSLIPAGTQLLPWFATVCFYSYYGPWKYFFLFVVISFHFISFLCTLKFAIFEGKGRFKCMNYRLILARIPPVPFQDSITISCLQQQNIFNNFCCFLIIHSLPNSNLWSIPNVL